MEQLLRLSQRIRGELVELARLVERTQEGWRRAQQTQDDFYLDSAALNLHGFYTGLERLFELIAATIDGSVPRGANWHQTLLEQMAAEVPAVRPAVISADVQEALDEYRGFRHIVRNIYTFALDSAKVQSVVEHLSGVFAQVRTEMLAFADFLDQQAAQR